MHDDVPHFTRRDFCLAGSALASLHLPAAAHGAPAPRLAAADLVSRIDPATAGGFVAGAPESEVTGVLVATRPGIAELRQAVAAKCNLIVSPETPFYGRAAAPPADPASPMAAMLTRANEALAADPTMIAKKALIADNRLVVYRLPDHAPPESTALADALGTRLGWRGHRAAGALPIYSPPGATLRSVVARVRKGLGVDGGLRIIGDPAMRLKRILVVPGTAEVVWTIQHLRDCDALLTGDLREWEIVEYLYDSANGGSPKALIAVGRILSEKPYAEATAEALRTAAPGLKIVTAVQHDPFWRIQA